MDLQVSDIKLNLLYPPYINHHYILLFSSFHFLVIFLHGTSSPSPSFQPLFPSQRHVTAFLISISISPIHLIIIIVITTPLQVPIHHDIYISIFTPFPNHLCCRFASIISCCISSPSNPHHILIIFVILNPRSPLLLFCPRNLVSSSSPFRIVSHLL